MRSTKLLLFLVFALAACAAPAASTTAPAQIFTLEPTATQEATATPTPIPTPTITPSPTPMGGGSGRLIFTYRKDEFMQDFPNLKGEINVFVADVDAANLTPITHGLEGYNYLIDVSPDGTRALIASTSQENNTKASLYVVDLSANAEPVKIADSVPNNHGNNSSSKWLDDSNVLYVGQGNSGFGVYQWNVDNNVLENIHEFANNGEENRPFEILAIDLNNERIYWNTHSKLPGLAAMYDVYNVWWSNLNGKSERTPLEFNGKQLQFTTDGLVFSPDGTKVAWVEDTTPPSLHIAVASDMDNASTLETMSSQLAMTWFPDSSKLLVFDEGSLGFGFTCDEKPAADTASDLYGVYEVSINPNVEVKNHHIPTERLMTCESWGGNANYMRSLIHAISPDGRQLTLTISRNTEVGIDSRLSFLDLETLSFSETSISTFGAVHWTP